SAAAATVAPTNFRKRATAICPRFRPGLRPMLCLRPMEFEDEAFVLSARPFGEAGAIVELLTARHGKYAAHVAGGASRKMKPFLQAGAQVSVRYRARISDQLGSVSLEPQGQGPSALFDDPLALAGLAAAAAVA